MTNRKLLEELHGIFQSHSLDRQAHFLEHFRMADICEQLRKAIRESGMTSYRLNKLSGVAISAIDRFMSGERDITFETANQLCLALGLEITKIASPEIVEEAKRSSAKKSPRKKPS